ncbi:MAG: hypothetical protein AAFY71_00505 [Bacteroidota bacterium]
MDNFQQRLDDLSEIRGMMENASRFISLSGLSGVSAGLVALIGAWVTYVYVKGEGIYTQLKVSRLVEVNQQQLLILILIATIIFLFAAGFASFFTVRRARRLGKKVWSPVSQKVLVHMLVPLVAGGLFCIIQAYHGYGRLVSSTTLMFYGFALINASKFTYKEIRNLGYSLLVLGIIGAWTLMHGIVLWAIGFGIFHILYGIIMYLKYERIT